MSNFYDKWNNLNINQQNAVKKKLKDEVENGYDVNKIKNHIQNNQNPNQPPSVQPIENKIETTGFINNITPKAGRQTPTQNYYEENKKEIGVDKSGKEFEMNEIHIAQNDYLNLIEKNRKKFGSPKNNNTGIISKILTPNWKGKLVEITKEEDDNMPKFLNPKDDEYLNFLVNDNLKKENNGSFEKYWSKVKDKANYISDEIKSLTKEKFNSLNDEDKLRLYRPFMNYQQQLKNNGSLGPGLQVAKIEQKDNNINRNIKSGNNMINIPKNSLHFFNTPKKTGQGSTMQTTDNNIENQYKVEEKTIDTIIQSTKETINNLKNTGNQVIDSIGKSIEKIYEETKGDIEKIKNIPINVGIMVEDYYNQYILGEKKEKEQDKWKNISSEEFIKANEGRVWYFDTVGDGDTLTDKITGHSGLYFIKGEKEYFIDFYTNEYTSTLIKGDNGNISLNKIFGTHKGVNYRDNKKRGLRNDIMGKENDGEKRNIVSLKGNNINLDKLVLYYETRFENGKIPGYNLITNNCSSEVRKGLEFGDYFSDTKLIDFPLKLTQEVMVQELKNKFIGNNN